MDKSYEAPRGRLLSTLVIFVFAIGLLYTGFLFFKQRGLNSELERIADEKKNVQAQIEELRAQQVEEVLYAQDTSERIKAASIKWSKFVKKLQDLTPLSVFYKSYTAGKDGKIQISALGDGYASVSSVIATLENSKDFSDIFVPSVSLGTTGEGKEVVTFSIELKSNIE